MQIVIVTGLSGAGKSTALRALEDVEFYCVDNIPLPFVGELVEHLAKEGDVDKVAVAIDARQRRHLSTWPAELARLRNTGHRLEVMYLDSRDDVLLRRFSETRRRHPLSGDDLAEGVRRDREITADLRHGANVVDTSDLNPHQLKSLIQEHYGGKGKLAVSLVSFGFKHGLPVEFNLVFDVRFLPNPYFEPSLTHRDGRDPEVARYVCASDDGAELLGHVEGLLRFALPHFQREGKLYVTVAIGCTGGRHRSVALVEELRRRLAGDWDILVRHRDVDRGE
ncbi:MAG: RNase adapter RapZ [Kofleriaceae bacterium]|nr:RNase adapter RapZ [Myxococcales bacterium]MCB9558777.1 RNase adapter RapZ [Kofleriaceae bacterium]MCB9570669.1 RNase adapter RapZ [Kofleriaceae bacterium]